ncbi:MAG: pitrilysin family protein [Marinoscillum sp.]|uniref:M16 family metallopeptidase n=1 Tax=Marinoscillum sp. TaxID=2024838 RepID=UPI0032F8B57C
MPDRSVAPEATAVARPHLPQPREMMLGNIPVTVVNQGLQPLVLFEIAVPVGRWEEPSPGLAFYLFKMLTEGTSRKSSEEIAEAFDFFGSHLEVTPTLDGVSIKLYTLNKFFPALLELLVEMLTESVFPESEFNTLKQIRIEQVRQQHAKNNAFANLKFREMLFGKNHPYGLLMDVEMVEKITYQDLLRFKSALLTTPQLYISGLVTDEEIGAIDRCFGKVAFHTRQASGKHRPETTKQLEVTREDSTQASIRLGKIIIDRTHPDIHLLKITNELLGGFFGSRLMKNIREKKGLTYGIHSSLIHLQNASYWTISSEILREKTEVAQQEILKEIGRLKSEPPGSEEFKMVINYMKGKFLNSFDSPFSSLEMIKGLKQAGLSDEYFYSFLDTLDTVRPEDLGEMATRYFVEDDLIHLKVV